MLIPYQVDTLFQRSPWANIGIIAANILSFLLIFFDRMPAFLVPYLVLQGWSVPELIFHQFVHAGILHLLFNMLYLWVFGNAVCAVIDGWLYPIVYLLLGMAAGAVH